MFPCTASSPLGLGGEYRCLGDTRFSKVDACEKAGVEPRYRDWNGHGSLVDFVVSLNLVRRHLNESQRATIGARVKPKYEEEAHKRMVSGKKPDPTENLPEGSRESRQQAARAVNVSPRMIDKAEKVIEKGSPELVKEVEKGNISVHAAEALSMLPRLLSQNKNPLTNRFP